jgi:hypothetical protein
MRGTRLISGRGVGASSGRPFAWKNSLITTAARTRRVHRAQQRDAISKSIQRPHTRGHY